MPASEFFECMQYEQLEPFGGRRGDIQAGTVAAMVVNVNRTKESDKVWTYRDFFKWDAAIEAQQTPDQHLKMMMLFQKIHNAQVQNHG